MNTGAYGFYDQSYYSVPVFNTRTFTSSLLAIVVTREEGEKKLSKWDALDMLVDAAPKRTVVIDSTLSIREEKENVAIRPHEGCFAEHTNKPRWVWKYYITARAFPDVPPRHRHAVEQSAARAGRESMAAVVAEVSF